MKTTTKTLLAALMLLVISCKKENNTIQTSGIAGESATPSAITDINELGANGNTVKIGSQHWKTKNLDVRYYRNGDKIPQEKDPVKWAALTTGAWCWYNNDSAMGHIYGRLYNWYAVNDPRGLAPEGWHIPSGAEWDTLSTFLGIKVRAGGKMKSTGTIEAGTGLWHEPNYDATNSSGFTGLPGGYRDYYGTFNNIGYYGYWWSSTEYGFAEGAKGRGLNYDNGLIYRYYYYKQNGFSVRCLRD